VFLGSTLTSEGPQQNPMAAQLATCALLSSSSADSARSSAYEKLCGFVCVCFCWKSMDSWRPFYRPSEGTYTTSPSF
jgi:hypothetical protein